MVDALRPLASANRLQFGVPDGGLYLWCRLPTTVLAADVLNRARKENVVFVAGEPFYCDRGGAHELRLCFTSQPPARAGLAARVLEHARAEARPS
jgi:2-aminoadipate transaminase